MASPSSWPSTASAMTRPRHARKRHAIAPRSPRRTGCSHPPAPHGGRRVMVMPLAIRPRHARCRTPLSCGKSRSIRATKRRGDVGGKADPVTLAPAEQEPWSALTGSSSRRISNPPRRYPRPDSCPAVGQGLRRGDEGVDRHHLPVHFRKDIRQVSIARDNGMARRDLTLACGQDDVAALGDPRHLAQLMDDGTGGFGLARECSRIGQRSGRARRPGPEAPRRSAAI